MKNSQNAQIRKALEAGRKITPLQALKDFKCLRLASRIADLRKEGLSIIKTMKKENGKSFAEYHLNTRTFND